jgi:hypothetical protein
MEAYAMMDKVSYGIFLLLDSKLLFGPVTPARAGVVHRQLRCNHGEHNGEGVPHRPPPPPPDGGLYVLDDAGVRLMVFMEMPQ